jgi:hypothetical protein
MATVTSPPTIPNDLVEAIRSFPPERVVEHCDTRWTISPFDIYAACPRCGATIKVRSFSGGVEVEDVFDAVFEWMNQPKVEDLIRQRRKSIAADVD